MDFNNLVAKMRDIEPSDISVQAAQDEVAAKAQGKEPVKEVVTESVAPVEPMDELSQFAALAGVKREVIAESTEVVAEKAVSKAQQRAAGAALATRRGEYDGGKKGGAINAMSTMSDKDLEDMAGTKHKGLPEKKKAKKEESFDAEAFRNTFESLVAEAKAKPDYLDMDGDGDKKEPMKKAIKDKKKNPFAKKEESVEESKDEKTDEACSSSMKKKKKKYKESFQFVEMMKMVKESGGQQAIDPLDDVLWTWANRVATSKIEESSKAELYAAMVYERNGGRFEMYDVVEKALNEDSKKNSEVDEAGPNPTGGASNATSGREKDGTMKLKFSTTKDKKGNPKTVGTQDFTSGKEKSSKLDPITLDVKF